MVQKLSDGQPITFEWLNSLVSEVNSIRTDLSANTRADLERVRPITFAGDSIASAGKIKVIADQHKVGDAKGGKAAFNAYVDFVGNGFKNARVIVVATADIRRTKASAEQCAVSVANVTKNGFTCTVTPIDNESFSKGQDVIINYIAIGDAP
jgi:hypothetical protein